MINALATNVSIYRNQLIDLLSKPFDRFLCNRTLVDNGLVICNRTLVDNKFRRNPERFSFKIQYILRKTRSVFRMLSIIFDGFFSRKMLTASQNTPSYIFDRVLNTTLAAICK